MLLFISKISQNGIEVQSSNEDWKQRRTTFTKLIGINHSSKYIPIMVKQMQNMKNSFKKDQIIDFSTESSRIFNIISKIIFGNDLSSNVGLINFISNDNTVERMEIDKFFVRLWRDLSESFYNPLTAFFPVLNEKNLVNPFKRDYKNVCEFRRVLKEFLKTTKDTESVFSKLKEEPNLNEDQILWDLITFLIAGTDTSAHIFCSALYFIQKDLDIAKKLKNEIWKYFPTAIEDMKYEDIMKNLEQWDYLNFVIKECFRLDPPTYETIDYRTVNDLSICGVPIPKDRIISINLMAAHMDPEQWFVYS